MEENELALSALEGTIPVNHQQHLHPHHNFPVYPQQFQAEYSFNAWNIEGSNQTIPLTNNISEIEAPNCFAKSGDEEESPWRRVKWTDEMVKLLITALSYITDDTSSSIFGVRTSEIIARKGKWRTISKVFGKRGFKVSPQQCEDKYNDVNKRYKRLVDILGRGISCAVVESPYILEFMDIPEESKDEVRKLLGNKQLFYREMCSYHNRNRLFLPEDEDLRKLLKLVLQNKNNEDPNTNYNWGKLMVNVNSSKGKAKEGEEVVVLTEGAGEEEGMQERLIILDNDEDPNANYNLGKPMVNGKSSKGKEKVGEEVVILGEGAGEEEARQKRRIMPDNDENVNANSSKRNRKEGGNGVLGEGAGDEEGWQDRRIIKLQKQSLRIQAQMNELKKEELIWRRICDYGDIKLEKFRLENEFIKLENARLANELKRRKIRNGNN